VIGDAAYALGIYENHNPGELHIEHHRVEANAKNDVQPMGLEAVQRRTLSRRARSLGYQSSVKDRVSGHAG